MGLDVQSIYAGRKTPLRVLAVGPHVDDVEIGCGATLLLLKRRGNAVIHVRVFSDHFAFPEPQDRAAEGRSAAERMAYDTYASFSVEDTNFPAHWREIQARLAHLCAELRPDLVLSPNPTDTHQDHVTLAHAVAREFRDGQSVWHYEINQFGAIQKFVPNLYVDVSAASESQDTKFRQWLSQGTARAGDAFEEAFARRDTLAHEKVHLIQTTMKSQVGKPILQPQTLLSIMTFRARQAGRGIEYAEAFDARTILA